MEDRKNMEKLRDKLQRSFSIVEDDDLLDVQKEEEALNQLRREDISGEDSEENTNSPKKTARPPSGSSRKPQLFPRQKLLGSAGVRKNPQLISDSEDSESEDKNKNWPGEYNPNLYDDLDVDEEVKELFQYITKYTPQNLNTEFKFKPFIPEFLPAVGDIDAFLKVVPPETTLNGEPYDENVLQLGLLVLDEPSANQSDPALLYLQLRAASDVVGESENKNLVVKKIDNLEKSGKVIDKWIKDISHLHKSKSSPVVRYSQPMPDLDDLMQEWSENREKQLKEEGFPEPDPDAPLSTYIDTVCHYFGIPISKDKIQSLHLLFCLYASVKQTQIYQQNNNQNEGVNTTGGSNVESENNVVKIESTKSEEVDQLFLD